MSFQIRYCHGFPDASRFCDGRGGRSGQEEHTQYFTQGEVLRSLISLPFGYDIPCPPFAILECTGRIPWGIFMVARGLWARCGRFPERLHRDLGLPAQQK